MVGIVIVSHSKQLAEGVRELVTQMVQGISLAVAAGIDDAENPLGTDAMQVYEAIASVYSNDGVLVLMDLGSALMSAEMALEFLSEEQHGNVKLCEAPLVEGAIAAAVAAATGSNIEQVIAEAREALAAKAAQLGVGTRHASSIIDEEKESQDKEQGVKEIRLTIRNQLGLHARPAAKFVATAARFQSKVRVRNVTRDTDYVRAESINQVATLGVRQGHEIAIIAQGDDVDEALAALQALVEANFGEDDTALKSLPLIKLPDRTVTSSLPHSLQGIPASPGVAIAPIFHYRLTHIQVERLCVEDVEAEWYVMVLHRK